jgi:two-component system phosphate regulon sensor histidine kinase PhoR
MLSLKARILSIALIVAIIAWVFGEIYGSIEAWIAVSVCLALLLFHQLWHSVRFAKILLAPSYGEVPVAMGIWGEIYYRLHKLVKGWRDQVLEVEQQHNRFIQAIQASPNGVVMLNEDDQIEWCNAIAESHFGLNARRDARQRIGHILRNPVFIQYIHRQNYRDSVRLHNMGLFEQFSLEVQIFPYGDKQKLILSQDVSQIEKTDAMRRDFVANVSHELKTPLTVLSGFLETVQEFDLDKEDRDRYLEMMNHQASRMKSLVEDLLILAKLEGNPEPPSSHSIGIDQLIQRLAMDAEGLSQGFHQIKLEKLSKMDLLGDESELYSAFSNLVSNAIRYTPHGGVITIQWADADDGGVEFRVKDTGPGISEEHIPRLTERFYRVDRSRSRDTGGTGLGLAIVKHVATRHQGDLRITSKLGVGSQFSLHFPKQRTI